MGKHEGIITVISVCNSIFNFPQDLKGKCIKNYYKSMLSGTHKEIICDISSRKVGLSVSGVFVQK